MLTRVIPSVLYVQYNDDESLQAFVDGFNQLAQEYVDFFATAFLPVWPTLTGDLLSWVGRGVYGIRRPIVPSGSVRFVGPYNSTAYNTIPYNGHGYVNSPASAAASDDVYKRVLTWALYKGDGRQFTTEWLKRRVERFLVGVDGLGDPLQDTYNVSVTIVAAVVTIRIVDFDDLELAGIFASLLTSGVLETPFQYTFVVII
jgi:hypothetical protein